MRAAPFVRSAVPVCYICCQLAPEKNRDHIIPTWDRQKAEEVALCMQARGYVAHKSE